MIILFIAAILENLIDSNEAYFRLLTKKNNATQNVWLKQLHT